MIVVRNLLVLKRKDFDWHEIGNNKLLLTTVHKTDSTKAAH